MLVGLSGGFGFFFFIFLFVCLFLFIFKQSWLPANFQEVPVIKTSYHLVEKSFTVAEGMFGVGTLLAYKK